MNARNGDWRKGRRFSTKQRAQLLKRFAQRSESAVEFARRHSISLCTLSRWKRQAGQPAKRTGGNRPALQEIRMSNMGAGWAAEVRLPDGTELRWNGAAVGPVLEQILCQLRRPC